MEALVTVKRSATASENANSQAISLNRPNSLLLHQSARPNCPPDFVNRTQCQQCLEYRPHIGNLGLSEPIHFDEGSELFICSSHIGQSLRTTDRTKSRNTTA